MKTKFLAFTLLTLSFFALAITANAQDEQAEAKKPDALGYWLTENERAVIHIEKCENSICGTLYWIIDGGMTKDEKNPIEALQNQPLCDMKIMWDFKPDRGNDWKDGQIYKADEGEIYNANITIVDENTLSLRGYVGMPFFGKSQTWKRVAEADYAHCTP